MPLYEYACDACGRLTEALQRLDDAPLTECPHCGGALRKLLSAPAFQFKGEGWYVTDYARKSGSGAKASGGAQPAADAAGSTPTGAAGGETSASDSASDSKGPKPE